MSMPGPMELVLIFLVILLLFGAKRIPEILRSFGEGVKEFKKGMSNLNDHSSNQQNNTNQANSNQSNPPQNTQQNTQNKQ
jgi:sec-independent protein translocase protein TatA